MPSPLPSRVSGTCGRARQSPSALCLVILDIYIRPSRISIVVDNIVSFSKRRIINHTRFSAPCANRFVNKHKKERQTCLCNRSRKANMRRENRSLRRAKNKRETKKMKTRSTSIVPTTVTVYIPVPRLPLLGFSETRKKCVKVSRNRFDANCR